MKTLLRSLSIAVAIGTAQAGVIFDIGDVVRPGGPETANTVIFGTSNTNPSSMTVDPGSSVAFSGDSGLFATYFASQTLDIGETLQLSYTATFANADASARGFRIGMFNTGTGTVYSTDQTTTGNFAGYEGYAQTQRITSTTSSSSEAFQRSSPQLQLLTATDGQSLGTPTGLNATNGTSYNGMFSLTRTNATTIRMDSQFGDESLLSFSDSDTAIFSFNTFAFQLSTNLTGVVTMTFTELTVSVVPEPTAAGLLLSGLALAFGFFGRNRKSCLGEG